MEGCRWLGDRLAVPAGELLAHGLLHEPAARDDIERLGDRLADLGQPAAAAAAAGRGRRDDAPVRAADAPAAAAGRVCCRTCSPTTVPVFVAAASTASSAAVSSSATVSSSSASWSSSWSMSLRRARRIWPYCSRRALASSSSSRLISQSGAGHQGLGALCPGLGFQGGGTLGTDHRVRRGEIGRKRVKASRHASNRSMSPVEY